MVKVLFQVLNTTVEHFYSSQEKHNLELVKINLDTTDLNEREALENGWLLYEDKWYQCRSTRVDINSYKKDKLPDSFSIEYTREVIPELKDIYRDYLQVRGFSDQLDYFISNDRMEFLILKDEDIPVAFTKFMHYQGGLESQLTCWNYHKPKLSLGKKIISFEVDYARSLGYDFLYIGEGCEVSSIYKADLGGFQFWTGSTWSTDKQAYKDLCIRDSTIKTLYDLSDVFNVQ